MSDILLVKQEKEFLGMKDAIEFSKEKKGLENIYFTTLKFLAKNRYIVEYFEKKI